MTGVRTWKIDRRTIDRKLRDLNREEAAEDSKEHLGGYTIYSFALVPIDRINVPSMWHAGRPGPLRDRMIAGLPIDPVRLAPSGSRYDILDGIHRTNVALEQEMTHVPAILEEWVSTPEAKKDPEAVKEQLPVGTWVKLHASEDGRSFGWIEEQSGFRLDRGVRRWFYVVALVRPGDDWPDFADLTDAALEPTVAPAWGERLRADIRR